MGDISVQIVTFLRRYRL